MLRTTEKEKKKVDAEKKSHSTPEYLQAPSSIRDVLCLIIYRQQRVLPVNRDGRGRTDAHNETCNLFPAVKMKSRNTKTIRGYDYDLLLLGCKIRARLLTRHKTCIPQSFHSIKSLKMKILFSHKLMGIVVSSRQASNIF